MGDLLTTLFVYHDRIFAILVGGFSIMDNHLHFLVRIASPIIKMDR